MEDKPDGQETPRCCWVAKLSPASAPASAGLSVADRARRSLTSTAAVARQMHVESQCGLAMFQTGTHATVNTTPARTASSAPATLRART